MEKTYTINGRITFIPQRGALILIADETKTVSLNMPASRCLLLLIQQDGNTVARETFFEEVWIKHGSQVTSNGFYQNISLLRRAFKELGMEGDIIITQPRVGVRLDATISVMEAEPCEMEQALAAEKPRMPVDGPVHEEVAAASLPEKAVKAAMLSVMGACGAAELSDRRFCCVANRIRILFAKLFTHNC